MFLREPEVKLGEPAKNLLTSLTFTICAQAKYRNTPIPSYNNQFVGLLEGFV